jgi:hypothetical protein
MLLVGKQEIDISLPGGVESVFRSALASGIRADSEFPADRTLQDGGHLTFSP